jgi:putative transposase
MARLGRYFLPDQPLHLIQRGNNREATFFAEDDYARYRDWLAEAAADYVCRTNTVYDGKSSKGKSLSGRHATFRGTSGDRQHEKDVRGGCRPASCPWCCCG